MAETKHLKTGDEFPSLPQDDKLNFLLMRFCPYAQRISLVLNAKAIPYNPIYINLKDKPEWITKYSPLGKVPALGLTNETGTPYIFESLLVADYLDEKYPQRPLYSNDTLAKTMDRILIERFSAVTTAFYKAAVSGPEGKPTPGSLSELAEGLDKFEEELTKRGHVFFGGDQPGMVDYMIWPWCERIPCLKFIVGDKYKMDGERYPKLLVWLQKMIEDPIVKMTYFTGEQHHKFLLTHKAGSPEFDMIFQ